MHALAESINKTVVALKSRSLPGKGSCCVGPLLAAAGLKKLEKAFEKNRLHDEARITMAAKAGIGWSTSAHTALPVLTTASGKWAERFTGFYENTDIAIRLKEIMK